jgi:hypothetical protein
MQQSAPRRHGMPSRSVQALHDIATRIGRIVLASSDGLKNRCASAPARTLKNWMVSRQVAQWNVTRGTSVFVISKEQRGQCGFMEISRVL